MPDPIIVDSAIIQQFLLENYTVKLINEKLLDLGFDEDTILQYVSEFKRIKNARRQTMGAVCVVAGAFLGFMGCVIAIVNPIPELFNWALFGLTTIAILLVCYGAYNLFE